MNTKRWRVAAVVSAWMVAIVLAATLDRSIANFAADHRIPEFLKSTHLAFVLKMPGEFLFTIAVAAVVVVRRKPWAWANRLFVLASGGASGVNGLLKWIVGRARPFRRLGSGAAVEMHPFAFQPFINGLRGLSTSNLGFPSGHATLAFATAAAMAILFPKFRWIFYAVAALTACERFLETAHYFSDAVAAAALGIGVVRLIAWRWPAVFQLPATRDSSTIPETPLG